MSAFESLKNLFPNARDPEEEEEGGPDPIYRLQIEAAEEHNARLIRVRDNAAAHLERLMEYSGQSAGMGDAVKAHTWAEAAKAVSKTIAHINGALASLRELVSELDYRPSPPDPRDEPDTSNGAPDPGDH